MARESSPILLDVVREYLCRRIIGVAVSVAACSCGSDERTGGADPEGGAPEGSGDASAGSGGMSSGGQGGAAGADSDASADAGGSAGNAGEGGGGGAGGSAASAGVAGIAGSAASAGTGASAGAGAADGGGAAAGAAGTAAGCLDHSECPPAEHCATGRCTLDVCATGSVSCSGYSVATCDTDGTGYGSPMSCTAPGEICSRGACITPTIDIVGQGPGDSQSDNQVLKLDFFSVSASVALRKIEAYIAPIGATTLQWVVYEALTQTGPYARIHWTITSSSVVAVGYRSSGSLNVPLTGGRYYALGVGWIGAPAYAYLDSTATTPEPVSFGSRISAASISAYPPPDTIMWEANTFAFQQRLTTVP